VKGLLLSIAVVGLLTSSDVAAESNDGGDSNRMADAGSPLEWTNPIVPQRPIATHRL
jgi:hypothetical protein